MQKNANIHWQLALKNIGPHEKTILTGETSKLQIGIYANNGVGKSFIGRAFDRIQAPNNSRNKSGIVQWGKKEGSLSFQVNQQKEVVEQAEAIFTNDNETILKNQVNYLYHVYNQEYVKQNLEVLGYQPNGDITGIVLGRECIDLTREKEELQQLKEQGINLKKEIDNTFEIRKKRLRKEDGVNVGTTEYKRFNFEEVERNNLYYDETESYHDLKFEYRELSNLPDEMVDISMLKLKVEYDFLEELQNVLDTSYTKGFFEEQFKLEVRQKESFIEAGIAYMQGTECPFCHQSLGAEAQDLIHRYTVYLEDQESKIIRYLKQYQIQLATFKEQLEQFYNKEYVQCRREYNCIAHYFKDIAVLEEMTLSTTVLSAIAMLNEIIESKKLNISTVMTTHKENIQVIRRHMLTLTGYIGAINQKIQQVNRIKNNNDKTKLELRKRICRAVFNETVDALTPKIMYLNQLRQRYRELDNQIKQKEYTYRTNKRQLVALTFKQLLQTFFGEKYTFDEVNFSLQYVKTPLNNQAHKVLSEGEKEVIAFCYYLASVHTLVNLEEDYDKVVLVIDDPVAHMDERYSHYVCEVLSQLSDLYYLQEEMKYIILSHSQAFIETLVQRKCIEKSYTLGENAISLGSAEVAVSIR